jgi:choline-sulfatase
MYMVRKGRWKYIHHVGYRPELFDLDDDRGEATDLGESPAHEEVRRAMEAELRRIVDPEKVCERAFADQEAKIARYGGVEAIVRRGDFGYSPAPGQQPVFATRVEA